MVLRVLQSVLLFLALGTPFVVLEQKFAAHRVPYRRVLLRDVSAYVVVASLGVPTGAIMGAFMEHVPVLALFNHVPLLPAWASIPIAVVASDCTMYWMHRLIHTAPLWRVHRWHHAPRHMYWLAGARASFFQGLVYTVPFLVYLGCRIPPVALSLYALLGIMLNHWMHSNIGIKWRWLEWIIITPRIHHIHHSNDPRHYGRNLGSLFSIWDRMFGTFLDPDKVKGPIQFGIPEPVPGPRLIAGL